MGKEPGRHIIDQEAINRIIAEEAGAGRMVVRLKGGDPFVLGRGGEEARALRRQGIDFEVVPGVTSAIAVPEAAGIPITDRAASSSFTIVSGHSARDKGEPMTDFTKIEAETVVILMGLGNLPRIAEQLMTRRPPETPVAVIQQGTTENEKVVIGTLENIA
ncbi:MAG: uroporphyrinogen-III C-methyltransferase, partial [Methanobacteriota archaeon]